MELIIIISFEITGIKLLPKIREFNDFFSELSGEMQPKALLVDVDTQRGTAGICNARVTLTHRLLAHVNSPAVTIQCLS